MDDAGQIVHPGSVYDVTESDTFGARSTLEVGGESYEIFRLDALQPQYDVARLPYSLKVLLENLLRHGEDAGRARRWRSWVAADEPSTEIAYTPARVLMQDFTGVPAIVDLAAMRDAMDELGGDPARINPLVPVELVIDHSIQVDVFAERLAFQRNAELEFERNRERYAFLRWGQTAFDNFSVVPPNTGICHQVNLEYLARVVETRDGQAFPDTLVGTDSHTTMINGLGVLGWGVGGIEAEAAMLGQPISMLIPQVVGFRLTGELPEGATATDLVLTVTQMLREHGVVGKFVEFFGPGLRQAAAGRPRHDRQHGARVRRHLRHFPGRRGDAALPRVLRPPGRAGGAGRGVLQGAGAVPRRGRRGRRLLGHARARPGDVVPVAGRPQAPAGPRGARRRGQDFLAELAEMTDDEHGSAGYDEAAAETFPASDPPTATAAATRAQARAHGTAAEPRVAGARARASDHGAVVIAAITSCTNTSNPSVMLGAGLLAKKAVEAGLTRKPWVKTSLAPGSKVVTEYLERAGLIEPLSQLGFDLVGYGCTTCIGNSGPLPEEISRRSRSATSWWLVLSGNRNFEGRIHPEVRMNYLASPPLCVAYALAGRMDVDVLEEPLQGDVYLRDIWPSRRRSTRSSRAAIESDMFRKSYGEVFEGDENWNALEMPEGDRYAWDRDSTYVRRPPYFDGMPAEPPDGFEEIRGARVLAVLGDSVTTDHISPAGAIKKDSPAGEYLIEHGVEPSEFNSYGSRRGNHEVMMRGTFANVRLRNKLAPGTEGGFTKKDGEETTIYDAAVEYAEEGVPLCVLAGKEYGSGSSRDWAAKGPRLLGVRAVIAESYERIHRSNLVGMGVLPLQFPDGESAESLGLTGRGELRRRDAGGRRADAQVTTDDTVSRSRRACGSTPPTSGSTTAAAASCTSCCAACVG